MQKLEDKLKAMGLEVETTVIKDSPEGRICNWKVKAKEGSNASIQQALVTVLSLQNVDIYQAKLKD